MSTRTARTLARRLEAAGYKVQTIKRSRRHYRLQTYRIGFQHLPTNDTLSDAWTACGLDIDRDGIALVGPGYHSGRTWPHADIFAALRALEAETIAFYVRDPDAAEGVRRNGGARQALAALHSPAQTAA